MIKKQSVNDYYSVGLDRALIVRWNIAAGDLIACRPKRCSGSLAFYRQPHPVNRSVAKARRHR
jgi:hypothetical protein